MKPTKKGRLARKVMILVGERIAAGEPCYALARELGVSVTTVRRARIALGIAPRPVGRPKTSTPSSENLL